MSITVEQATRMDRRWFSDHPEDRCFIRPLVPGEVPAFLAARAKHILLIRYLADGYIRKPLQLYTEEPGTIPSEIAFFDTGERWCVLPSGAVRPAGSTEREIWEAVLDDHGREIVRDGMAMEACSE